MRFKIVVMTMFCIVLSACTNTKIHIYGRYMEPERVEEISKSLKNAGFEVVPNTLMFPSSIYSSTILYSPFISDPQAVDTTIDTLTKLGIKIGNTQPLVSGNHWYKKNSMAVFVLPAGKTTNELISLGDLSQTYLSANCEKSYSLVVDSNSKYTIDGDGTQQEDISLLAGSLLFRKYPFVELRPQKGYDWTRYFEIRRYIEQDVVSKIEMIELVPLQPHQITNSCSFRVGLRVKPDDV